MPKKTSTSQKFQGYDKNYIADLLKIVNRDVQDNVQIENVDYLDLVESACEQFNKDFNDDSFDNRSKKSVKR